MLYNETLDIISSSDNKNKTSNFCIIHTVLFSVFNNEYIYGYLYLFLYSKNRSTKPYYFSCLIMNGY